MNPTIRRVIASLWSGLLAAEIVLATKYVLSAICITPELIQTMNSSPEWYASVNSILTMLHPSMAEAVVIGMAIVVTCWFMFPNFKIGATQ